MNKKTILIVGKLPPPYFGTTVWFQSLQQASWSEEFIMLWFDNNIHQSLSTVGIIGIRKIWLNIKLYFSFYRFVLAKKPDLILIPVSQSTIGFMKDSVFIRIAKKRSPTLLILHGSDWLNWFRSAGKFVKEYVSKTLKGTHGVVVLGEKLKYLFVPFYDSENIYVVPNGIDLLSFKKRDKKNSTFLITYLGNLLPSKGIKEIIESLVHLKEENIKLQIIGEWTDKYIQQYCMNIIRSHDLPVEFKGRLIGNEKFMALSNSDLFIFAPNKPEGQPMVIIEAMASGLPIISTDQGAITESVIDGLNGFIVEPNNAIQISKKIKYLIDSPEILFEMGVQSRMLYEEKFTGKEMIKGFEKVFRTVLQ